MWGRPPAPTKIWWPSRRSAAARPCTSSWTTQRGAKGWGRRGDSKPSPAPHRGERQAAPPAGPRLSRLVVSPDPGALAAPTLLRRPGARRSPPAPAKGRRAACFPTGAAALKFFWRRSRRCWPAEAPPALCRWHGQPSTGRGLPQPASAAQRRTKAAARRAAAGTSATGCLGPTSQTFRAQGASSTGMRRAAAGAQAP